MSVDPFLRIYMVKGKSKTLSPFELDKVIDGGECIGQIIESKSSNFKVGDHVKANFGWREYWLSNDINSKKNAISKIDSSTAPSQNFLGILGIQVLRLMLGCLR